jgi:sugar phosphate isomerase/epimerase
MRLGIQGIVFGKRNSEDFPGVLRDVKAAGYDGIEIGYKANQTADEVKTLLSDAGLVCCGYHAGYDVFKDLDTVKKHAEQLVAVGGKYLMCSGVEGWQKADRDAYSRSSKVFNEAGGVLKDMGVTFCYHNHQWEFYDLGGTKGMDVLTAETDPALVKFCLDVYWIAVGGDDPVSFIRRHADRAVYFHFKDGTFDAAEQKPITFTELGNGQVDLKSAITAARERNPEWIVTEQDKTEREPAESARISAEYARRELGV